ncbi:hypothetical protein [Saccharothrix coeruleofusca]|uniref:Uncharacterized protein n=1 Tax=Saccharothrix coeruleofusca TaxID=33919 RepID=A0A918EEI1_9PSEU|nr:hypothetical protein [Saccharothrix coeruleofusca]MBP2339596.1 hypothetical protein [Saccharothrix coeruleofusca]GGP56567.1 hypothetical protein GCM10010185_31000 [Saccharothrix coeruleofusca]
MTQPQPDPTPGQTPEQPLGQTPPAAGAEPPPAPSMAAFEADLDALMNEKMGELDGMLAGLEQLVDRLEGEISQLEDLPDEPPA